MLGMFSAKRMFQYTIMPEFVSRLGGLMSGGFQNIAYLVAILYQMVRLLPDNHAYLDARNIGRFGVRHVIAEAANNLTLSFKNLDQIILFFAILIGMVMLVVQIFLLAASLFLYPVMAAPTNWNDLFVVANPHQDIAYIMLDLVFGVTHPSNYPDITKNLSFFESCIGSVEPCLNANGLPMYDIKPVFSPSTGLGHPDLSGITDSILPTTFSPLSSGAFLTFPFPMHLGMQALFGMYNLGLLIVASMILCYFIATVVAETAQSGTPFGKRFNKFWAPIRIVVAFGLLMPLGFRMGDGGAGGISITGLNSAQYIVLYAAKYGSALATNGWNRFNDTLTANYLNGDTSLAISHPNAPEIESLSMFMWLANVCYHAHTLFYPELYKDGVSDDIIKQRVRGYIIANQNRPLSNTLPITDSSYIDAINFLDPYPKMMVVRFGPKSETDYAKEAGNVKPICGEIQIPITDARKLTGTTIPTNIGPVFMQAFYYALVKSMWNETGVDFPLALNPYAVAAVEDGGGGLRSRAFAYNAIKSEYEVGNADPLRKMYINAVNNTMKSELELAIKAAIAATKVDPKWLAGPCANGPGSTLKNKGWGAAGIWYNCIAELNGNITTGVMAIPEVMRYPEVMEDVVALKAQYNVKNTGPDTYQPTLVGTGDSATQLNYGNNTTLSKVLYAAHKQWLAGSSSTQTKATDPIGAAIATFLGVNGLYDMRKNKDVHPLAQLVGIGRALVEAAIRKLGYALAGAGVARLLGGADGGLVGVASSMMVTIAMLGLTAGFVLFYIVPFLPFIYFFFALGGWVKGIFEAMVGAPLWAMAHIRIDGHGLPGSAALNGYFLIFEIFVRPILTLFGLLASVSIFGALVKALDGVFDLVVYNVSGFDIEKEVTGSSAESVIESMRGTVDEFFFTIIYAVIVYMMAMSSFKLIDQIPNNILRWMGQSVATFGDTREDPAQGLMGRASMGSQQAFSRMGAGMQGVVGAVAGGKGG